MTIVLRSAAATHVGRERAQNEDACFAGDHVFVVADGLGGHRGGEVASALAVEAVRPLSEMGPAEAAAALAVAAREANRTVLGRARSDPALAGMGTTLTAAVIDGMRAHLVHVGDSRAYLFRDGVIEQLTVDHTVVARMVADGRITPEEAERHPQRSMLTRALGSEPSLDVDEMDLDLHPGDRLLLCSDGLTNMLTDEEIGDLVSAEGGAEETTLALVDAANSHGGVDNITVVLVEVDAAGDRAPAPTPPPPAVERSPRSPRRRAAIWTAVVLGALIVLGGALKVWANGSWYVGESRGEVAVFHGVPVDLPLLGLNRVAERTGIAVADLPEYLRRGVTDGIAAKSREDARRIVSEQIAPNTVAPEEPSPRPSP